MSNDRTRHSDEAVKLYDCHSPEYWHAMAWFAMTMYMETTCQNLGSVRDYYSTVRRKKSALARKWPERKSTTVWFMLNAHHGVLSGEDDGKVLKVRVPLPLGYELHLVKGKPKINTSYADKLIDIWNRHKEGSAGEHFMAQTLPPIWYGSIEHYAWLVRLEHDEIFGPFLPEPDNRWATCPSGSILVIGDDIVKATRIWHADRRDILTEQQQNRLATFSNWPGFYSLRPYKHRPESLSVRQWNRVWHGASCCDRVEMYLARYGPVTLKPFKSIWRVPPHLQTMFNLVPLATIEQLAKYRYPDGPAEEKDPDGT